MRANYSYICKVYKRDNPENIFVVNVVLPDAGLSAIHNDVIYNVKFRPFGSVTIIELPIDATVHVGDIITFEYLDFKIDTDILKLPKCDNDIYDELNNSTCYYLGNQLSIFPTDFNIYNTVSDPKMVFNASVFGEYLFATLYEFIPTSINHYTMDIYNNGILQKPNVKMFTDEWVGIHYYAVLHNILEDLYYTNIKLSNKSHTTNSMLSYHIFNWILNTEFVNYKKFNINQHIMSYFQDNIDISIKVVEVDKNITLNNANLVTYKKYINTYDHIALSDGIFDNSDVYQKIKNNIDQNGFKSIPEYEIIPDVEYVSESIVQSENGQFNYADTDLYMLYTSKIEIEEDSTINLNDSTVEYQEVSMIMKLHCEADATSYTIIDAFICHYDFTDALKKEIIKISDTKQYYCNTKSNMLIDFQTHEILFQKMINAESVDTDSTGTTTSYGVNDCYKYAPMLYEDEWILYELPNYKKAFGRDIQGYYPVIYEYNMIKMISDPINSFGNKPAFISDKNCITDVLFTSNHLEVYLNLNSNVQYYNYDNIKLNNITDENVVTYQNGTTSYLLDDNKVYKMKDTIIFNTHSVFNDDVISILNVETNYDSTTGSYSINLNHDVFGDYIYLNEILNTNEIDSVIYTIKANETIFILMTLDDDIATGTVFEDFPKNIIIKANYEILELDGEIGSFIVISYPVGFINFNTNIINKYYRYRQINRFKSDYLDKVFYMVEI